MKYLILSALVCVSCNRELPSYATVSKLRIIGLKTTNPEISPGDTVPAVSALILDPDGGGRALTYSWQGCMEPLSSENTRFDCDTASDKTSLGTGTSSNAGVVTIPAGALSALPTYRAYNGINYIVALTVTAGNETVRGFKRIVVSSRPVKNANPTIASIARNGVNLNSPDTFVGGDLNMSSSVGGAESYNYQDAQGNTVSLTEDLLLTWFHTEGKMQNSRTFGGNATNLWKIGSKSRSTVSLAVVVNDGRGGVAWLQIDLN